MSTWASGRPRVPRRPRAQRGRRRGFIRGREASRAALDRKNGRAWAMASPQGLVSITGWDGSEGASLKVRSPSLIAGARVASAQSPPLTLSICRCPPDLNAMCDLAKIADLVLLVVDGHFGFEMETFEFLNMCQVRKINPTARPQRRSLHGSFTRTCFFSSFFSSRRSS
jgi:hypothetical protein